MRPFRLARRTLLRGAGAALALPMLDAMLDGNGEAFADGTPLPRRFGVWFWGNGVVPERWIPAGVGATWQLSESLAPLAAVKDYLNVATGYEVKGGFTRGHHDGCAYILSGAPFIELPSSGNYASKFSTKSIDQLVADAIGQTPFRSLQLGVSKRIVTTEGPTLQCVSHRGPDSPLGAQRSPANLYKTLFANFTPKPVDDPEDPLRVSTLDRVQEQTRRLQRRLGAADRSRLDQHLTGIAEVRARIQALPPPLSSCAKPAAVTDTNSDQNGSERFEQVSNLMSDLLALAFACDLSRVMTMQFTGSVGQHSFTNLGQSDNHHDLSHDSAKLPLIQSGVVFTMKCLAYLLEKLKKTPEGSGNLLDRTCILATSDCCKGVEHSLQEYPLLVCGRGDGALRYPGIHLRSTTRENTSDVLLACVRAAGVPAASIGAGPGLSSRASGILV